MGCREWLASVENDPFAKYAVFESSPLIHKLGYQFGWPYLPRHLHEILFFAFLHFFIYILMGPLLTATTKWYAGLPRQLKNGIGVHASSELNALIALPLSFPLFFSRELNTCVSYTPFAGLVASALSGYFLFDIYMCLTNLEDNGLGFLFHGITAFFVFMQGNRPFMHNFSAAFIWFEASTPFVNFNWLATNIPGLVNAKAKTINGAILIVVFLICRIIPGPINGYRLFAEALPQDLPGVPKWVVYTILLCYTVLTSLNFLWFGMMLKVAYDVLFGSGSSAEKALEAAANEVTQAEASVPRNPRARKRRV